MAGVGKSTIGSMVSKQTQVPFYDTDKLISNEYNQPLNHIINDIGESEFLKIESTQVLKLFGQKCIVSPGGSFIYSSDVVKQIKNDSLLIYLYDEPSNILNRIPDISTRGIIGLGNKSFYDLWFDRHQLFRKNSNLQFNIAELGFETTANNITETLRLMGAF